MDERVAEEEIEAAAAEPSPHTHEGIDPDTAALAGHLSEDHHLEVDPSLSAGTQSGLHDRVHEDSHAVDK